MTEHITPEQMIEWLNARITEERNVGGCAHNLAWQENIRDFISAHTAAPVEGWRCFQCDKTFTDRKEAERHFGYWPAEAPLCSNEHAKDATYWRDQYNAVEKRNTDLGSAYAEKLQAQSAEIARLREALQKYGRHSTPDHHCAHMVHSKYECDCGLDKALATDAKGERE